MMFYKSLLALGLMFSLTGCLITDWENVSHEDEFKPIIGDHLESKVKFVIHGVTMERNYEPILHHFTLMKAPGFSGPEVLNKEVLPVGTKFSVSKVIRCVDCLVKEEKIVFTILSENKFDEAPVIYSYDKYLKMKSEFFK